MLTKQSILFNNTSEPLMSIPGSPPTSIVTSENPSYPYIFYIQQHWILNVQSQLSPIIVNMLPLELYRPLSGVLRLPFPGWDDYSACQRSQSFFPKMKIQIIIGDSS